MIKIKSAVASNVGNVRSNNEDNFFLNGKTLEESIKETLMVEDEVSVGLFAVCDGMGGEESGEIASAIAVNTLNKFYEKELEQESSFTEMINLYSEEANAQICTEIEKNDGKRMGTTFAILYIKDKVAHAYNIGDSRIYLFRDKKLKQISQDHTRIKNLLEMGILTEEKAKTHPERHILTQHLGIFPEEMIIEVFSAEPVTVMDGDVFLLCSDGLSDMVSDSEIEAIMNHEKNPKDVAEKLIDKALSNGGKDNVTVIVSEIEEIVGLIKRTLTKYKFISIKE